jgi:N-acetylmuramoyl-L-alanine amidase
MSKYSKVCVFLDNGHGSNTAGKRSPDGKLMEYAYARDIVSRITKQLSTLDIPYYIVTPETTDISLSTRVSRINAKNTSNKKLGITSFLISVHVNAVGNGQWMDSTKPTANYWTAWTSKGQTQGDKLATQLYKAAHEVLEPVNQRVMEDNSDGDPDYEADFYILKHTNCAATLTENLFQDNSKNVEWLLSEEGRSKITELHVKGIQYYIKNVLKIQ